MHRIVPQRAGEPKRLARVYSRSVRFRGMEHALHQPLSCLRREQFVEYAHCAFHKLALTGAIFGEGRDGFSELVAVLLRVLVPIKFVPVKSRDHDLYQKRKQLVLCSLLCHENLLFVTERKSTQRKIKRYNRANPSATKLGLPSRGETCPFTSTHSPSTIMVDCSLYTRGNTTTSMVPEAS